MYSGAGPGMLRNELRVGIVWKNISEFVKTLVKCRVLKDE